MVQLHIIQISRQREVCSTPHALSPAALSPRALSPHALSTDGLRENVRFSEMIWIKPCSLDV